MSQKTQILGSNCSKSNQFRFTTVTANIAGIPRHIRDADENLKNRIRVFPSLKLPHRGSSSLYDLYDDLLEVISLYELHYGMDDFRSKYWCDYCCSLGFIHDVCSVKGSPDYTLKSETLGDESSIDTLLGMFESYSRDHGQKRISKVKYNEACKWLVIYLNKMVKFSHLAIQYVRQNNFKSEFRLDNKDYSIPVVNRLIGMLEEYGLVKSFNGNTLFGSKSLSMFVVNPKLLDLLGIDGKKYQTTVEGKPPYKITCKEDVIVVNQWSEEDFQEILDKTAEVIEKHRNCLSKNKIQFGMYEIPEYFLQRVVCIEKEQNSRFFDNGSIQCKTRVIRKMLEIGGENVVSLDFKAIHPAMLLEMEGYSIKEHDPYPSFPSIKVDKVLIRKFKKFYDLKSYDPVRNIVKKLMLCLINADNVNAAVGSCYNEMHKDSLKAGTYKEDSMKFVGLPQIDLHKIAKKLIRHNSMIAHHLGVGIGSKLQYNDSLVIMNCLDVLSDKNIPCLPVHDALICKESDKDEVEKVMAESFVKVMGKGSEKNCIIEQEG